MPVALVAGAVVGGVIAGRGAKKAGQAVAEGNRQAILEQRRQYDTTRKDFAPYRVAGVRALSSLQTNLYGKDPNLNVPGPSESAGAPSAAPAPVGYNKDPWAERARADVNLDWRDLRLKYLQSDEAYNGKSLISQVKNGSVAYKYKMEMKKIIAADDKAKSAYESYQKREKQFKDMQAYIDKQKADKAAAEKGDDGTIKSGEQRGLVVGQGPKPGEEFDYKNPSGGVNSQYYDFYKSPGYQFRLDEGFRGVNSGAASKGRYFGGRTLKELTRYGQNYASGEYGNYMNRIAAIAGLGQTATNNTANYGQQATNRIGSSLQNIGNAYGSSYLGQAKAYAGVAKSLGNYFQT